MSEKRAKRLRREARERGGLPKPKQFFKPLTVEIKGREVYIPRKQRRMLMRKVMTNLRKGRIDLDKIREENEADDRQPRLERQNI